MNGVTGRMGTNQHLMRSILAIREQGGVAVGPGRAAVAGADARRPRRAQARRAGRRARARRVHDRRRRGDRGPDCEVYFDAQVTSRREASVRAAIAAGRHVYCEKPMTEDLDSALALARLADEAGVKHGVVQDKLFLPGIRTLKRRARQRRARARAVGARRVRLLGLPRSGPGAAAAVVELPRAGRRRHRRRHVRSLALRARRAVRLGARSVRARRHAPPRPLRRAAASRTTRPPRTPPTRCSSSTAA